MIKLNKIFLLGLSTALFAGVANAEVNPANLVAEKTSEPKTVIFRIENIEPIKNEDNLVKSCSFVVTVYNRLDKAVKEANLDFAWQDRVSQKYIDRISEKAVASDDELAKATGNENILVKRFNKQSAPQAVSSNAANDVVKTELKIFNVAPHSQKSFTKTVETSKCFLLFDNLNYNVRDCMLDGEEGKKAADASGCAGKFNYINSKNPEYYSEFGDIPLDVAQNQTEDDLKTEQQKFQETYDEVTASISKAAEALKKIQ